LVFQAPQVSQSVSQSYDSILVGRRGHSSRFPNERVLISARVTPPPPSLARASRTRHWAAAAKTRRLAGKTHSSGGVFYPPRNARECSLAVTPCAHLVEKRACSLSLSPSRRVLNLAAVFTPSPPQQQSCMWHPAWGLAQQKNHFACMLQSTGPRCRSLARKTPHVHTPHHVSDPSRICMTRNSQGRTPHTSPPLCVLATNLSTLGMHACECLSMSINHVNNH
jgi:hypothetical protein